MNVEEEIKECLKMVSNSQYGEKGGVKEIVKIGLMSAFIYVATAAINVPIGPGGVIHLGDSMIFVSAILFGWKTAAISGAIGMTLFDLLSPYAIWAPFTFVVKAIMGYIAGRISHGKNNNGNSLLMNILGVTVSGAWMIFGYYIAESIIYSNIVAPIATIPANFFQVFGGAIIAIPLTMLIKKSGYLK